MPTAKDNKMRFISDDFAKKLRKQLKSYERKRVELMHSLRLLKTQSSSKSAGDAGIDQLKDEITHAQQQINDISHCLLRYEIMKKPADPQSIQLGSTVKLTDGTGEVTVVIVDSIEVDPLAGKISSESIIGQALLGCSASQEIKVPAAGKHKAHNWKITQVS